MAVAGLRGRNGAEGIRGIRGTPDQVWMGWNNSRDKTMLLKTASGPGVHRVPGVPLCSVRLIPSTTGGFEP